MVLERTGITSIIILCTWGSLYSCTTPEAKHPRIGNFALPSSQQPGTLYGFGQNIVDKGDLLLATTNTYEIATRNTNYSTLLPYLIYGITDDLAVLIGLPIALQFNEGCYTSSGLQDAGIEFEYIPYSYSTEETSLNISIVGGLLLPFGSIRKHPHIGHGSPTFFTGVTVQYLSFDWYWFISPGAFFTTAHNHTRFGNRFLYQTGFGKNLAYKSDEWLCTLMLEFSGICIQKSTHCGVLDPNTGGNEIGIGPTIWFSTQRFIFQAGILPVVYQHWNGNQAKDTMFIDLNFAWKF